MTRIQPRTLILAGLIGLSACSGSNGPSEFVTRSNAACIKERGQEATAYCACNVRLFDEMLTEKDKRFFLTIVMNDAVRAEDAAEETRKGGFTEADMGAMAAHLAAIQQRSNKECPS